jgi:hypothetical protein
VTSEDHNSDALIAALRSPAVPTEQVGEAAAVTAMLEVLSTTHARVVGHRTRRGITIAAVTVASLGVGGLVAAGPGFFQAAADKVFTNDDPTTNGQDDENNNEHGSENENENDDEQDEVSSTDDSSNDEQASDDISDESDDLSTDVNPQPSETDAANTSDEVICAEGNHGQTVSSVAQATESGPGKGQVVSQAAQSDCGKTDVSDDGSVQPDDPGDGNGNGQPEDPGNPNATTPADTRPTPTPPTNPGNGNGNGQPEDPGNPNATTPADTRPTPTPPTNPGNGNGQPDDPGNGNGNGNGNPND